MRNPLVAHPPWRQLVIISVVLPVLIGLAVLAFAWPVARATPRDLPVGIVGTSPAGQQVVEGLARAEPGGFDFHLYADGASARSAIENREIYGAFVVASGGVTVLEAGAASPAVAQLLSTVGQRLASHATEHVPAGAPPRAAVHVRTVDVVATSADDPRGLIFNSAVLPLTICGVIVAAAIGLLIGFRPAWRQLMALCVLSAIAGLGSYLIAQTFLGALPHDPVATWAALSLTLLAIGSTTAGLIALIGAPGLGLSAALMVFVGNPFSGATSAPQLLPDAVDHIGQWLPPGAGANLLRSTAYFNGNGAAGHLAVLILWTVFGAGAIIAGHHAPNRFACRRLRNSRPPVPASIPSGRNDNPAVVPDPAGAVYRVTDGRADPLLTRHPLRSPRRSGAHEAR